ncbi:MAG: ABC transporter substrate-binding protein [Burkholderiales bacterium]|uniref:ABC transporter substrate-binding protein n=1 Tax=Ottowia sp. TaxID=1898956 RepID=UPI001AC0A691|nr:helical backbone metal receptor [Ottowia sp.]MBN9405287.1 ABC transporter substrate-binding protein [Burkholderiales bacterium]
MPSPQPSPARGRGSKAAWTRAALGALLAATFGLAQAYAIHDDAGQVTRFDTPPARIVSLLPSLTETVCALGACERLVGVDRYANWPPPVQRLPKVGGGLDPSVEAVVALRPDVVLMDSSARAAAARLRALGLKVVALQPRTLADLRRVTERLGELLRQPQAADALLRRIDAGVQAAAQSVPGAARGQRVYFEVDAAPHAAGRGTFIDELLTALGLVNIVDADMGPYPKINPEWVVRADPDLIMISRQGAFDLARRPGWAQMRALRQGHVCAFDAAQRDILVRPGPRMAEAAQLMADCAAHRPPAEK